MSLKYKNVLLKFSGEALKDQSSHSIISHSKMLEFVEQIQEILSLNIKLSVVIGGGNIIRGGASTSLSVARFKMDNIGMLGTLMNAIVLQDYLEQVGIASEILSGIDVPKMATFYTAQKAIQLQNDGIVVIFAGGIGNPYFSTDTCAILRALESNVDIVLKGTQVDGVYNKDPKKYNDAVKYDVITHGKVIEDSLGIMDLSAIILAQKNNLPIKIFNFHEKNSLINSLLTSSGSIIIS